MVEPQRPEIPRRIRCGTHPLGRHRDDCPIRSDLFGRARLPPRNLRRRVKRTVRVPRLAPAAHRASSPSFSSFYVRLPLEWCPTMLYIAGYRVHAHHHPRWVGGDDVQLFALSLVLAWSQPRGRLTHQCAARTDALGCNQRVRHTYTRST